MEKVVETKTCKHCSASFDITDTDLEFYEKASPIFGGKKYLIPPPAFCPPCRQQRRLSWRNETNLYRRKCDLTGKEMPSIYSPEREYVTYNQTDWWGKAFSPLSYGRDFDFTRPFFEQFQELQKIVPRIIVLNGLSENTDYANHSYHNKNSYMLFSSGYNEECFFCVNTANSEHCVDCFRVFQCQHIYEGVDCERCNNSQYIQRCKDCFDCYFCIDCENSKHCIGCKNLKNKEYYVYNQQVTPEEFEKVKNDFFTNEAKRKEIILEAKQVKINFPSKALTLTQCEKIDNSNQCINSEDISCSFDIENSRNLKYTCEMLLDGAYDCYDYDVWGENSSLIYEVHCTGNAYQIQFSNVIWGGHRVFYSDNCLNEIRDCFGCIGLHDNEQYCILNKQYTKQEYEELVQKIIEHMQKAGEWGEFFPSHMSPFGYNQTNANHYFPLTREQAIQQGFNWSDYEPPLPKVDKIIPAGKLPFDIKKVPDDILNWAIECEVSRKPFRIIKQELAFYRAHNIPLPKRFPDIRYKDRFTLREPRTIYDRKCDKCGRDIQTTYSPERPETIYCESCYNKEGY